MSFLRWPVPSPLTSLLRRVQRGGRVRQERRTEGPRPARRRLKTVLVDGTGVVGAPFVVKMQPAPGAAFDISRALERGFDSDPRGAYAARSSMNPMELRGRRVLVTGASSGLGREMARILALTHGAHLLIVARRKDRLDELKAELEQGARVEVETCVADLSLDQDVERVIACAHQGRPLFGAILNAGVTHFGPYHELGWEAFRTMLATNVTATVRLSTALIPLLEQQGGGLMIVSSMAGIHPVPYQTHYSGTKAFLVHYGIGLWHELAGRSVSVTTYAPSGVVSEMTAGDNFVPLRRWLMPVDQAALEGIEAFRTRKYLHISGLANRVGSKFARILPQRLATSMVAAQYRNALKKQGPSGAT